MRFSEWVRIVWMNNSPITVLHYCIFLFSSMQAIIFKQTQAASLMGICWNQNKWANDFDNVCVCPPATAANSNQPVHTKSWWCDDDLYFFVAHCIFHAMYCDTIIHCGCYQQAVNHNHHHISNMGGDSHWRPTGNIELLLSAMGRISIWWMGESPHEVVM